MLKIYQNTYYPPFSFKPKTGIAFPQNEYLFLLCSKAMRKAPSIESGLVKAQQNEIEARQRTTN